MPANNVSFKTVALRESVFTSLALKGLNLELLALSVILANVDPKTCKINFNTRYLSRRLEQVQGSVPNREELLEALDTLAALNILKAYNQRFIHHVDVVVNPTLVFSEGQTPEVIEFTNTTILMPFLRSER
jgi:hypothetical protein